MAKRDYVSLIATAIRQKVGPSAIGDEYTLNAKEIHEMIFRAVSTNKISFTQVYLALSDTDRAPEREDLFGGADMELEFGSYSRYERFALAEHYLQIRELERELMRKQCLLDEGFPFSPLRTFHCPCQTFPYSALFCERMNIRNLLHTAFHHFRNRLDEEMTML